MPDLIPWEQDSTRRLQREISDLLDEFRLPHGFRREMDHIFDDFTSARPLWREMDRLLEESNSPPPLRRRIARAFERFMDGLRHPFARTKKAASSSIALDERDDALVVTVELPNVREEDVDVRVDGNVLTIRGEHRTERTKRLREHDCTERSDDSFSRSVALPPGMDLAKIDANFSRGVLEVHIPKLAEAKGRKIPVSRAEPAAQASANGPALRS